MESSCRTKLRDHSFPPSRRVRERPPSDACVTQHWRESSPDKAHRRTANEDLRARAFITERNSVNEPRASGGLEIRGD